MKSCQYDKPQQADKGIKNTCDLDLLSLYKQAREIIVRTESPEGGIGSGFLISNGKEYLVITAEHNLDENSNALRINHKKSLYSSHPLLRDSDKDIAILKLDRAPDHPPQHELLPSLSIPQENHGTVTIGFPLGVKKPVLTPGLVRGTDSSFTDQTIIESKQACNFGNSGGIQLQKDGKWWGMQEAAGGGYNCLSLSAADIIERIRKIPGWENYASK